VSDQDDADRPATFREVLASGEYRALYLASALSWFGDYVARAAITALVYQRTGSVAASAATFAISYVPWLGFGPILAALAERLPYRQTMVVADLARMVLVALVAIPGMPIWAMIVLLFLTSLGNPPFDASRSALLAKVLTGDRYVVGMTLQTTSHQAAQIAGYLSGAGLAAVNAQVALLLNAATFGVSALLIIFQIRPRPAALAKEDRTHLLRETADGLRLVFTAPLLRGVAIVVFLTALFAVVPEGLAAAWAASLADGDDSAGWVQGAIMISNPVGFIVGGLVVGRFLGPKRRQRLVSVFAVAVPASLAPALFDLPVAGVLVLSFLCGAATASVIPATNGLFVQALPNAYRARAFGVMKSGIQVLQGLGVFVTGFLADRFALHTVVGVWGLFGIALMAVAILTWPNAEQISAEIARAQALNKAADDAEAAADEPPPATDQRDPQRDIWGFPVGGQLGPAIGRARVVTRADDPWPDVAGGRLWPGEDSAGRQGRQRISRPVGRIYSTGAARPEGADPAAQPSRPSRIRPPGLAGAEPIEPLGAPGTDLMGAAAAAGLLGEPTATDPQWYPLAEPPAGDRTEEWPPPNQSGWDPETRAQRAHHRAVQQHAAHQQQRTEQAPHGDQRP
jgi:MFS family permease